MQKKCLVFSLCMHGGLLGVLILSSGFRNVPDQNEYHLMTLIPSTLVDRAGSGGGGGAAPVSPPTDRPAPPRISPPAQAESQPQPAPQEPKPSPPVQPQPQPRTEHVNAPERVERPQPHRSEETSDVKPETEPSSQITFDSHPKPPKRNSQHHKVDVTPSFTEASVTSTKGKHSDKPSVTPSYQTAQVSHGTARATARITDSGESSEAAAARARAALLTGLESTAHELSSGIRETGSGHDISRVLEGVGGGDAFAGYGDAVVSIYRNAWITPNEGVGNTSWPVARIEVNRDGTIISAVLLHSSGSRALDNSVRETLDRVRKLPAFPSGARDSERTFTVTFNLDLKKSQ